MDTARRENRTLNIRSENDRTDSAKESETC